MTEIEDCIGKLTGYRCPKCGCCLYINNMDVIWCSNCSFNSLRLTTPLSACKALGYDVYLYDCQNGEITFSEHIEYDKYLYYYVTDSDCSKPLLEISNEVVNYLKMFAEYYLAISPFDFPNSNWRNDSVVSSKVNGPEFVTAYKRGVKK